MVRLKVPCFLLCCECHLFQFHYGTIKRTERQQKPIACANFNSTMVRLKETMNDLHKPQLEFQFHYGTIKSTYNNLLEFYQTNFNSTMVRLKGYGLPALYP